MNRYAAHVKRVMAQERPHGREEAVAAMRKAAHLWHGGKVKSNPVGPNPLLIGALAVGGYLLWQRSKESRPAPQVTTQTQMGPWIG